MASIQLVTIKATSFIFGNIFVEYLQQFGPQQYNHKFKPTLLSVKSEIIDDVTHTSKKVRQNGPLMTFPIKQIHW